MRGYARRRGERALNLLRAIRRTILSSQTGDLRGDFPEALVPLWCLRNNARKQIGQHIDGELTFCTWGIEELVFPTVAGERLPPALRKAGLEISPSASSIISVTSLDANMRGLHHMTMDGRLIRPSLVLLDDPQTRESARSPVQTRYRLDLLNGDVLGLAGPGEKMAAFVACTVMYEADLADQLLDRQKNPQWQGERMKMVYAWPADARLWDEYHRLRDDGLRRGEGGRKATDFYRKHRREMDAGAAVAWPARYNTDELSAIQHAYNLLYDRDQESFQAEFQNEPATRQEVEVALLAPVQVAGRFNGRKRGDVPLECAKLTAFIDVHKELLYWCAVAWREDFTGYVIDYGTEPQQHRSFFTLGNAPHALSEAFRGAGEDGAIQAGLEKLVGELLQRAWPKAGGAGLVRIDRLLVDMGYKPGLAGAVKHKAGGATMMLSKGVGIRAGSKPIAMYDRRPGWTLGHHWYCPCVAGTREFPHVCVDVNYWKTFIHDRLAVAPGDPAAMTLYGTAATNHGLFAEHIAGSETYVLTSGHGRQLQEWRQRPSRPDNHWLDCLVGCAAAAAMLGAATAEMRSAGQAVRPRKRYTQADLATARRGGPA